MGLTASKANKDGSISTGGFKFVSIRGDPQYNHYFRMLELGMSMEQVRLLLERDGYKGNEMDDPEAISHLHGQDPVARRKKAWARQRKKRSVQRGSIAEALKAQKGKKTYAVDHSRKAPTKSKHCKRKGTKKELSNARSNL